MTSRKLIRILFWPSVLAAFTLTGLVLALLSDSRLEMVAMILLAIPLAVIGFVEMK